MEHDRGKRTIVATTTEYLFKELRKISSKYLFLPNNHFHTLVALWIMHTYIFELFDNTPYIWLTSPEPSCGKTIFLEILDGLAHNTSGISGSISAAGLRRVCKGKMTLILDEAENLQATDRQTTGELMQLINLGYQKGGKSILTKMKDGKATNDYETWDCYAPKAMASLNPLTPTIPSRSFKIVMQKGKPSDGLTYYSREANAAWFKILKGMLLEWTAGYKALHKNAKSMPHQNGRWELFPGCHDDRFGRMGLPLMAIVNPMIEETGYTEAKDSLTKALRVLQIQRTNKSKLKDIHIIAEAFDTLLRQRLSAFISQDELRSEVKRIDKGTLVNDDSLENYGLVSVRHRLPDKTRPRGYDVTQEWVDEIRRTY